MHQIYPFLIVVNKDLQDLSNFLNDIHLDAVYCTDYNRTRNTALPTAIAKDIDITLYDTQNLNSFSKHLLANKQDALVVGHSYSTGVLAGLLTNETIGVILSLDIYNRIYQVVICGPSHGNLIYLTHLLNALN